MIEPVLVLIVVALFSYAFYKWATFNNDYFKKRNIKYMKPTFLFGSIFDFIVMRLTAVEVGEYFYVGFPDEP